jgi:cation transport regulator ChaC
MSLMLKRMLRLGIARSWWLSKLWYRLNGLSIAGRPDEEVWYFAFGANMHDSAFRERRGMSPLEWRPGRIENYRLRFNLEGRPKGRAAPANIEACLGDEVCGVLYRITRRALIRLDATEGVPGPRYRPLWLDAVDSRCRVVTAITYIAKGAETDGNPYQRYLTLLREGARMHDLPEHWTDKLDRVRPAE